MTFLTALGLALGSLALIFGGLWILFKAADALDNSDWAD